MNAPAGLKAIPQWLAYRPIGGKKPPIDADGRPLKDWKHYPLSFAEAAARAGAFPDGGLGFLHGNGWGGIDADDCRNPETGEIDARAMVVLKAAKGYAEVSPSGKGFKVFGKCGGWLELNFNDPDNVTVAKKPDMYFAFTGNAIENGGDVEADITAAIEQLTGFFSGASSGTAASKRGRGEPLPELIPKGTQNDTLFHEGCRHRRDGRTEDQIFKILMELRHRCKPVPDPAAIREIAKSCMRYDPTTPRTYRQRRRAFMQRREQEQA